MTSLAVESSEPIFHARSTRVASLRASRVATTGKSANGRRRVPLFIPADQAYYWTSTWQQGEAETRANLDAGNARTFADPMDAIRHLLDDC